MVVDSTINHTAHLGHHLAYSPELSPIVCQLGGRDGTSCGQATKVIEAQGYDEINLNIDCPSSRVSGERKFGAILMHDCDAACSVVSAMDSNVEHIPISVKCRIGIELDNGEIFDTFDYLVEFIGKLRDRGCRKFFIHARKCVIGGLTPAQNRIVPPLDYPRVYALCDYFPDCDFVLNAGIPGLASARTLCHGDPLKQEDHCNHGVPCVTCNATNGSCITAPAEAPLNLVGCMIGRACREHPAMFWDIDRYFYGEDSNPCSTRREALEKYCLYLESCYPRRCCDNDARKSARIPTPTVEMFTSGGCPICKEFYGDGEVGESRNGVGTLDEKNSLFQQQASKEKITTRAIGRSLAPVRGLFFGVYGGKCFKTQCDQLVRNVKIRNCGPGYILRKAMANTPCELLDQPFIKTENLNEADVPVHVSPSTCHVKCT